MPISKMSHAKNPKDELLAKVGSLDEVEVFHNQILVAVYERPDQMQLPGGKVIYLSDNTRGEDKYQGKAGLVLKHGPLAFVGRDKDEFAGQSVERGDWIAFRVSDGWSLEINGVLCRMIHDVDAKLRIPTPDFVY